MIVYPQAIPLETDLLNTNKFGMIGLAKLAAAVIGTNTQVNGFSVGPNSPNALNVVVQPGEIYSLQNVDSTAYSSIPLDTAHTIVKQGINLGTTTLAITPPVTAGQSINYLIQVQFQENDTAPVVLPYYNSANPTLAFAGANNLGVAQNTMRQCQAVVTAIAGTAATTGTQTTPAATGGGIGVAVVTVAYGATSITAANISILASAPYVNHIGSMLSQTNYLTSATLTAADVGCRVNCGTTTPTTITMPLMASTPTASVVWLTNSGISTVTVQPQGSDTMYAGSVSVSNVVMPAGSTAFFERGNGGNWFLFGGSAQTQYAGEFASTLAANGSQNLPGGLIMNWLTVTTSASADVAVTWQQAFKSAIYGVQVTPNVSASGASGNYNAPTITGANIAAWTAAATRAAVSVSVLAWGK